MLPKTVFFFIMVSLSASVYGSPGRITVTNDDIRDALLQVVNVVRNTDDKLDRHEYRDRALGEQLKKAVINLDKRVKMLEPLKNGINRLDERLAAIETFLMSSEETNRMNLEKKAVDMLETMQNTIPAMMEQFKNEILNRIADSMKTPPAQIIEPVISKKDFEKLKDDVLSKIKNVNSAVENVENEIQAIGQVNRNMNEMNNKSNENLEKVKRQLSSSESLLAQYESKLAEYNNKIPEISYGLNMQKWEEIAQNTIQDQINLLGEVRQVSQKIDNLPNKTDHQLIANQTFHLINQFKDNSPQIESIRSNIDHQYNEINRSIQNLAENAEKLDKNFMKAQNDIRNEISKLDGIEDIVIQSGDAVMDTKRRLEYVVHEIVNEVTKQIKNGSTNINQAITDRFTLFESALLDADEGALANLTLKIGEEIDQVWRQIGIMHQQMSVSTDTLNKLQNQTDQYVNGSLNVMDTMKGKVGLITGRMTEVDENLNFLLGKLSLVTQEFNQIRSGLGKALDEIKNSFHQVENQLKDVGPGPHNMTSQENTVDPQ